MINLHCHSLLSDGCFLPSELAIRYRAVGYKVIAITDHADYSNIEKVISGIRNFTQHWPKSTGIQVLSGVELTHLPPEQFAPLVRYCRKNKIQVVIGHGQTPVEPVIENTNRACLEAEVDILAHPGYLSDKDAKLASKKKIFLEITSRSGHSRANSYVVKKALIYGCRLVLSHDSHQGCDIISWQKTVSFAQKAGLTYKHILDILKQMQDFVKNV
ncbi:MAG: histidinol phosphate phosphatase domain-containing protein [Candidatus Omnitrophica bacterium]|nr:histidinol phosphate phosphatase domain-containing protein [Candidatus Omnitrophota bacterium]